MSFDPDGAHAAQAAGAGGGMSAPPPHRRSAFSLDVWVPPLLVLCGVVGAWWAFSYLAFEPDRRFLLPPPHEVVNEGFLDWRNLREVLVGLGQTTQVALTGLALAIALGMLFAVLMSQAKWVERSFYPYAVVLQTIPILALVPLVGVCFGFNFRSRVIVCVIISLFPVITNTLFGLQSVDRGHHDLFTLYGAGRLTRLWKLQLPSALPAVFAGLRISAGLSVIGAIVGEFFFRQGTPGLGRLLDRYHSNLQREQLFTAVFFSSLLGVALFWAFGLAGSLVLRRWHPSAAARE